MSDQYEELRSKFHLIQGTHIAGKIFTEYSFLLKEMYDTKIKGETTKLNRLNEAEASAIKVINILQADLIKIGVNLEITEAEIDNLEDILYKVLTLNEVNQKRVMNLITKLKKEEALVEHE